MFNLSGSEIVVILLLALVVLGPDKLPEAMRRAGKTWAELRKLSNSFQDEVRKGFEEPTAELRQTANVVKKAATLPKNPVKAAATSLVQAPTTETRAEPTPDPLAVTAPEALDDADVDAITEPSTDTAPRDDTTDTTVTADTPDDAAASTDDDRTGPTP